MRFGIPRASGTGSELMLGFTPCVAVTVAGYTLLLLVRLVRQKSRFAVRDRVCLTLGITIAVLFLAQLEYFGYRPWYLIWNYFPGAIGVGRRSASRLSSTSLPRFWWRPRSLNCSTGLDRANAPAPLHWPLSRWF